MFFLFRRKERTKEKSIAMSAATTRARKKKLLEKQKEGKKRMRQVGSVDVPSEAFMAVLKMD